MTHIDETVSRSKKDGTSPAYTPPPASTPPLPHTADTRPLSHTATSSYTSISTGRLQTHTFTHTRVTENIRAVDLWKARMDLNAV